MPPTEVCLENSSKVTISQAQKVTASAFFLDISEIGCKSLVVKFQLSEHYTVFKSDRKRFFVLEFYK